MNLVEIYHCADAADVSRWRHLHLTPHCAFGACAALMAFCFMVSSIAASAFVFLGDGNWTQFVTGTFVSMAFIAFTALLCVFCLVHRRKPQATQMACRYQPSAESSAQLAHTYQPVLVTDCQPAPHEGYPVALSMPLQPPHYTPSLHAPPGYELYSSADCSVPDVVASAATSSLGRAASGHQPSSSLRPAASSTHAPAAPAALSYLPAAIPTGAPPSYNARGSSLMPSPQTMHGAMGTLHSLGGPANMDTNYRLSDVSPRDRGRDETRAISEPPPPYTY